MNSNKQLIQLAAFEAAIIEAAQSVIDNEQAINAINFFPVSDKDTGTNLATTLEMLLADYELSENFSDCLDKVSEIVFDNARGNSGILFSIWFSGMAQVDCEGNTLSYQTFLDIFESANQALKAHLQNVMPGTMVSFLSAFTVDLKQAFNQPKVDLEQQLDWVAQRLKGHLHQTMEDNPTLKPHKVVDSGALGVYFFLSTLISHLTDEVDSAKLAQNRLLSNDALISQHEEHQTHHHTTPPSLRYCTEAKLVIAEDKLEQAKAIIGSYGDCDLFLRRGEKLRFHVHCNEPQKLFFELMHVADVKAPKIEDMLRQYQATTFKRKIALVTDTSVDLPEEWIEKYQIHLIPLSIFVDNNELSDGLGIHSEDLYRFQKEQDVEIRTSTPKMGHVRRILDFLKSTHEHVFAVIISSKMSGTLDAVKKVANDSPKITVFDAQTTAGSLGWLVAHAGDMIAKGYEPKRIYDELTSLKQSPTIFAAVDSLSAMIASGRVSALKGRIAKVMNLKPIISISKDGEGIIFDKAFSHHAALKKVLNAVNIIHQKAPIKRYAVLHVNAPDLADGIALQCSEMLDMNPVVVKPISTVIGLHIGQGAVVVCIDYEK